MTAELVVTDAVERTSRSDRQSAGRQHPWRWVSGELHQHRDGGSGNRKDHLRRAVAVSQRRRRPAAPVHHDPVGASQQGRDVRAAVLVLRHRPDRQRHPVRGSWARTVGARAGSATGVARRRDQDAFTTDHRHRLVSCDPRLGDGEGRHAGVHVAVRGPAVGLRRDRVPARRVHARRTSAACRSSRSPTRSWSWRVSR